MLRTFSKQDKKGEAVSDHGFPGQKLRPWCSFLASLLLITALFAPAAAYADREEGQSDEGTTLSEEALAELSSKPEFKEGDDAVGEEGEVEKYEAESSSATEGISLSLSDPEIWQEGGMVFYRTVLTAEDTNAFFGYQIEVEASGEDQVEVNGLYDGIKTDSVYKNSNLHFASMNTSLSSGDISACEIIVKYPKAEVSDDNQLIVRSFQAVTSISPETIVSFGPEPAAAVLSLPVPTDAFNWMILLIILCLIAALLATWFIIRKTKLNKPELETRQ